MHHSNLSIDEQNFIKITEQLIKEINEEFIRESKTVSTFHYDLMKINGSLEILTEILELLKDENIEIFERINLFLTIEYSTHLDYILLILARIFDDNKISAIKNKILRPDSSISKAKQIIEQNVKIVESVNNKISSPPNQLFIIDIFSHYSSLKFNFNETLKIFKNLDIKNYRDKKLAHNIENKNFLIIENNIIIDSKFPTLLEGLYLCLSGMSALITGNYFSEKIISRGYSIKQVFNTLKQGLINDINYETSKFKQLP